MLCLCSKPQILEDLLGVGSETVVNLEFSGLRFSFMLSEDSIVAIREGLQLDFCRQFPITRIWLCRFPQRKFLESAIQRLRSQLLNFNGPIQRENRSVLIDRPERFLLEGISLILLDDTVQLELASWVDEI